MFTLRIVLAFKESVALRLLVKALQTCGGSVSASHIYMHVRLTRIGFIWAWLFAAQLWGMQWGLCWLPM